MSLARPAFSTQLPDASLQHHGRFLLSCRKLFGSFAIEIEPPEGLVVRIRHGHQPMMMLSAPVFFVVGGLRFGQGDSPRERLYPRVVFREKCEFRFGSGLRLGEAHGHARDPADDIRLSRIRKPANLASRVGIGNRQQMTFADFAPAANILIPQFDEVDRTLVLVGPFDGKYLSLIPVNLHDGTGPNEGPHGEIRQADHTVYTLARVQVLD